MMRIAAIFCVWDDWYLLDHSTKNIQDCVDSIIVIGSEHSNFGEYSEIPAAWKNLVIKWEPYKGKTPAENETAKRNYGLEIARKSGYTHFIMMDADEFYFPEDFNREKQRFISNPDLQGLVCDTETYFGSPQLTIGSEGTRVPFIQKITPGLRHEFNRKYPFAWEGKSIRIDPTRSTSATSGIEWSDIIMFHYSWVRKDFEKKIRNSTARANLERSTIRKDLMSAKSGYFVNFYQKELRRAPNYFNIPDYGVEVPNTESVKPVQTKGGQE